MSLDLQALGFTQEELQERVIEQIVERVMNGKWFDEDGDEVMRDSRFAQEINKRIEKQINDSINALAEKYVLPNVAQYVENLTLQETNKWGEKKGKPITFIEYLVLRAQDYMQQEVNNEGKTKEENGNYSFYGKQTRITFLIERHLHNSIETAMKNALSVGLGEVAKGIHETARIKLNEIAASMKVVVAAK